MSLDRSGTRSAATATGGSPSWSAAVAPRRGGGASGSFDYLTAPDAGGLFLGDYSGLISSGTTFAAFFGMSQPVATAGRSDIFANTAH